MWSKSPKPTHLLLLNMPNFLQSLHRHRVRTEIPRTSAIGKQADGSWSTTALKEYPPALCRCISHEIFCNLQRYPVSDEAPILPDGFLSRCRAMVQRDYGEHMGCDFAGAV